MKSYLSILIGVVMLLAVLSISAYIIYPEKTKYIVSSAESKYKMEAYDYTKERLIELSPSPKTTEFPKFKEIENNIVLAPDGKSITINGWLDSQNVFGSLIRTKFICKLTKSKGEWVPIDMEVIE